METVSSREKLKLLQTFIRCCFFPAFYLIEDEEFNSKIKKHRRYGKDEYEKQFLCPSVFVKKIYELCVKKKEYIKPKTPYVLKELKQEIKINKNFLILKNNTEECYDRLIRLKMVNKKKINKEKIGENLWIDNKRILNGVIFTVFKTGIENKGVNNPKFDQMLEYVQDDIVEFNLEEIEKLYNECIENVKRKKSKCNFVDDTIESKKRKRSEEKKVDIYQFFGETIETKRLKHQRIVYYDDNDDDIIKNFPNIITVVKNQEGEIASGSCIINMYLKLGDDTKEEKDVLIIRALSPVKIGYTKKKTCIDLEEIKIYSYHFFENTNNNVTTKTKPILSLNHNKGKFMYIIRNLKGFDLDSISIDESIRLNNSYVEYRIEKKTPKIQGNTTYIVD